MEDGGLPTTSRGCPNEVLLPRALTDAEAEAACSGSLSRADGMRLTLFKGARSRTISRSRGSKILTAI